jgi:single-stranded-DNA-specific exonuclease
LPINAGDVGFKLAPRINAAGRLDNAAPAYELLLTNDPDVARTQAQFLNDINIERQQQTKALQERIANDIQAIDRHQDAIIVHADPHAHAGQSSLVAARLADQFSRPTIIIEQGIPHSRGSGQAGGLIDLVSALRNCGVEFIKMGGHAAAAGFTIDSDAIDHLRQALNDYAATHHIAGGVRILPIDAELDPATLDMSILTDLAALEVAYGQHNNAPLLLTRNCRVVSARATGER